MPIRINLREIFSADSQTIAADKINFNFNKLLELGVGDVGPQGDTGAQGPAGPVGPDGDTGPAGLTWNVGSVDPNTVTIAPVQDGDFYLNTTDSTIWQWDETGSTWNQIIDFTQIIDDYLATTTNTFIRGFGSPEDNNLIIFPNRDELGTGIADILFLSNFDETQITIDNLASPYTDLDAGGILQIYADHTASYDLARPNFELGSLYSSLGQTLISTRDNNLKVKHYNYDNGDDTFTTVASFNVSKLETSALGVIDRHGAFEFISPNFVDSGTNSEMKYWFGSKDALANLSGLTINASGFLIKSGSSTNYLEIGIADGLFQSNATYPYQSALSELLNVSSASRNYAYIKSQGTQSSGIFVDDSLYQDNGNIIQVGTGETTTISSLSLNAAQSSVDYWKYMGMAMYGDRLITIHGEPSPSAPTVSAASNDQYHITSILDPSNPIDFLNTQYLWTLSTELSTSPRLTGACDIDIAGDYAYIVSNQDGDTSASQIVFSVAKIDEVSYGRISLLRALSTDSPNNGQITSANTTSTTNLGYDWSVLSGAYRVKVVGNYAYVINKYADTGVWSGNSSEGDAAGAYLTAIDISNPYDPVIANYAKSAGEKQVTGMSGSVYSYGGYRHLALDANMSIAATLTWKSTNIGDISSTDEFGDPIVLGTQNQILLNLYDLSDARTDVSGIYAGSTEEFPIIPSLNRFAQAAIESSSSSLTDYGSVAIFGNYVYCTWENTIYVYSIPTDEYPASTSPLSLTQVATYSVDNGTGGTKNAIDSKISGRFVYILWFDGEYSSVTKHDLIKFQNLETSASLEPIFTHEFSSSDNYPSRLIINGKYIYVCRSWGGVGTAQSVYIETISTDGFVTPAAHIDSLQAGDVKVYKDINVGNSAKVGYSLNVGSGGIQTNGDVSLTGGINANLHNFGVKTPGENSSTLNVHDNPLSGLLPYTGVVQSGVYQFTGVNVSTEQRIWYYTHANPTVPVAQSWPTQSLRIIWTRVGNVVNLSGYVYFAGSTPSIRGIIFPAPLYPASLIQSPYTLYTMGTAVATDAGSNYEQWAGDLGGWEFDAGNSSVDTINVINGATESVNCYLRADFYNNTTNRSLTNIKFSGSYILGEGNL